MKGEDLKLSNIDKANSMAVPIYKTVNRRQKKMLEKERVLIESNLLDVELDFQNEIYDIENNLSYSEIFEGYAKYYLEKCNEFLTRNKLKYHELDKGYFIKTYQG